jgi:Holliday junction resolvase RusA-like endonuclease
MKVSFTIPGPIKAKARHHTVALKRCNCNGKTTTANQCPKCGSTSLTFVANVKLADAATESYESWVALCAQQAGISAHATQTDPVALRATFLFSVPPSRKKKLVEGQPHLQRPDLDNCQKSLLDGLNRVAWHDDCCVVAMQVEKKWTLGEPGVKVELEYLEPQGDSKEELCHKLESRQSSMPIMVTSGKSPFA